MKKNINKIIKIMTIAIITIIIGITTAYSAPGLSVVLANQNPDPVTPGNLVEINIKVANSADKPIENAKIKMEANNNFKVAQGQINERNLGVIPAFSTSQGSRSYVIVRYLIEVSPNAPLGLNPVRFNVETTRGVSSFEFDISILNRNPILEINKINIDTLEAGKTQTLNIEIENKNPITLRNVEISLDLLSVDNRALSTLSGSNRKIINILKANEKKEITFEITANPDSMSKPYILPINIKFQDNLENKYEKQILGSVKVYSTPFVLLRLESQEKYSQGRGRFSFSISNPGTSAIKGMQVEFLESENYEIIDGKYQYIGDLNPDDFQTMQSNIFLYGNENTKIKAKLTYLDSYNNKKEEIVELPIRLYSEEQLLQFGIKNQRSSNPLSTYILIGILLIVTFIVGRKIGYKKGKNKLK